MSTTFELIPCRSIQSPMKVRADDGTHSLKLVARFEPGPDARAFSAARAKKRLDYADVANQFGMTPAEVKGLERGEYTLKNWPDAHAKLRGMLDAPEKKPEAKPAPKPEKKPVKASKPADDE
jgi:hypothetical protein